MRKRPDLIWFAESLVKPNRGAFLLDTDGMLLDANRRSVIDRAMNLPDQVFGKTFILIAYERVRSK